MKLFYIIAALWLPVGGLGSYIADGSIVRHINREFPDLPPMHTCVEDRAMCMGQTLGGPINLIAGVAFATISNGDKLSDLLNGDKPATTR